jgi:4-hydroxybenzoate polyprenyltransferase
VEADRRHPVKKYRPLAAGLIPPRIVKITAAALLVSSMLWGAFIGTGFFLILVIYLTLQALYNYRLKEVVVLDIFCISSGFFLRVIGGALAIQVEISHWLIICTILISMFLAMAKRRQELVLLGEAEAGKHRKVLSEYNTYLLDQMIGVIVAGTLLSYMLYCISSETIKKFQTDHLIYSFPFVLYGVLRYLYLSHKNGRSDVPEKILVSDIPLLLTVIMWGLFCMLIIYRII